MITAPAARAARTATLTAGLGIIGSDRLKKNERVWRAERILACELVPFALSVGAKRRSRRVRPFRLRSLCSLRSTRTGRFQPEPVYIESMPPSIRFVLVRTSHPGNIGAAARA